MSMILEAGGIFFLMVRTASCYYGYILRSYLVGVVRLFQLITRRTEQFEQSNEEIYMMTKNKSGMTRNLRRKGRPGRNHCEHIIG